MGGARRESWPETVGVGQVLRPHGVHGELVVEVLTDLVERFTPGSELLLVQDERREPVRIEAARWHRGRLLVTVADVADRDAAAALRGARFEISSAEVEPPPAGSFYYFELVNCRCRDHTAGELGTVVDVLEDGGGLLLLVADGERRLLVPFVSHFLRRVDVGERLIETALPAGLIETCASRS